MPAANLKEKLDSLPQEPGVYIMKDHAGRVIYVGKAVNLRERVRSYFSGGDLRAFVPLLDRLLGDIETVVVHNEKEALLLENELIRRHKPRFNVRPREGRNFVYLRLDTRQRYPRLEVTRRVQDDGARYFGPYPLAHALRETLRVVNRYFKLRTCSDHDPMTHTGPCLLCQIASFPAPSVYDIPEEEYRRHVDNAILFLEGRQTPLVDVLRRRMTEAAEAMRFEEAARLRDQLAAIERTLQPQEIVAESRQDEDAFGYFREGERLVVYVLYTRRGRVIGGQAFPFGGQAFPDAELLASFLSLYYSEGTFVPDEVLLPLEIDAPRALADLLARRKGSAVRVAVARGGRKGDLVQMAMRNAAEAYRKRRPQGGEAAPDVLVQLKARLGLGRLPRRMECFDVSHFHGGTLVASKVAMADGRLDKDRYRRYRVTSVQVGDDFAAMFEVVSRRLRRGMAEHDLPDLLVMDGGKGQLASALAAIKDVGVTGVDVVALAKAREAGPGGPPYEAAEALPERVFVPGRKDAIVPPQNAPDLLLLVRLRDEAHRFAITYQRKLMRRERMVSPLQEIPGVGAVLRRALLRRFGSLERVTRAGVEELMQVEGIGPQMARRIRGYFEGKLNHREENTEKARRPRRY